tara:strand:+ start:1648 stop:2046 length:399 start_codon:yes stop_codon:yes gene_type:complete
LYINLIQGLVWLTFGIWLLVDGDKLGLISFSFFAVGVLYVGHFLYDYSNQYLIIENGTIRKNKLYGSVKAINLKNIKRIKKIDLDYTLKTERRELKINTTFIEEQSLAELNKKLAELNIAPEKTPFTNNVRS